MKRIAAISLLAIIALSGCKPVDHYIAPNVPDLSRALTISSHTELTYKEQEQLDSPLTQIKIGDRSLSIIKAEIGDNEPLADKAKHVRIALDTSHLAPPCQTAEKSETDCVRFVRITSGRVPSQFVTGEEATSAPGAVSGESGTLDGKLPHGRSVIEFDAKEAAIIHVSIDLNNGASTTFNANNGAVVSTTRPFEDRDAAATLVPEPSISTGSSG